MFFWGCVPLTETLDPQTLCCFIEIGFSPISPCVFKVLNEVVVDRGPSSYLSNVDLFLDGHLITTVQGDGTQAETLCILGKYQHFSERLLGTDIIILLYYMLHYYIICYSLPLTGVCVPSGVIVSTPTGSTAYAVAAGASMIHPNVPAIMITPICPHSLSFRPIVVPAGVELKVPVPLSWVCRIWISSYIWCHNMWRLFGAFYVIDAHWLV